MDKEHVECSKCHEMVLKKDAEQVGDSWICDVCWNEDDGSYQDFHYLDGSLVD